MADKVVLKVLKRTECGKGAAKKIHKEGLIPAVIYGNKKAPETIKISPKDLLAQMRIKGFRTRQFELDVEGTKELTLCQDIQFHKVKDNPLHVDFLRIDANKEISIEVPLFVANEETSKGMKAGGVLNIVRREIEVVCKATNIPSEILIDINDLEIGDSVHAKDLVLPEGVKLADEEHSYTVLTLAAPAAEEEISTEAPEDVEVESENGTDKSEEGSEEESK